MENFSWIIWTILGLIFIVTEIFTLGFVFLWIGIGALAAALMGLLGFEVLTQFITFAVVSTLLTILSRTIFASLFGQHEENQLKTAVDSLPGQIGTVTIESKGALNEGAVKVYGSIWTAFPEENEILTVGEKVEVVRVKGSSIFVRKVNDQKGLPEWRENENEENSN